METELSSLALSLEEVFYSSDDARLSESHREMKALEVGSGFLAEVSGLRDIGVVDRLTRLGVTPSAAAALVILPLVVVAWADGTVTAPERKVLAATLDRSLFFATVDRDIIEAWLEHRPPAALTEAWMAYAVELAAAFPPNERARLGAQILEPARMIASTAGGFLGFGGISPAERAALKGLAEVFA